MIPQPTRVNPIEYLVVAVLILLCASAIAISLFSLFGLPLLFAGHSELESIDSLNKSESFQMSLVSSELNMEQPEDSPVQLQFNMKTPPLTKGSSLKIIVSEGNKVLSQADCLEESVEDNYVGTSFLRCNASVPYSYLTENTIEIRALLQQEGGEPYVTPKISRSYNWEKYESVMQTFGFMLLAMIFIGFILIIAPVSLAMYSLATKAKHHALYRGEYTLSSLIHPFKNVKGLSQLIQAFIASPIFWIFELLGIILFVGFLAMEADAFKSGSAMLAFIISGSIAFFVPFLWVAAWWFADYKEREPLRLIVSLFLWGSFAALMTIGINSFVDSIFIAVGLGAVATALIIPIFEEVFKGTGLLIFSLHHEYDSVADGLVFGFTVGMGFAFIENWLYFIQNPMGADISAWVILFFMRSIMFSAMHGVYTSMTGGIIGFMRSRSMPAVLLFPIAVLPAIIFHAIHNSGELLMSIFGLGGLEAHCCIIMPLFDYGGLLLVALAMLAWTIMQRKKEKRKFRLKDKSRRDVQVRTE